MTIIISGNGTEYEYYCVPKKVANAVKALLDECGNEETCIITAQGESE